MQIPEFEEIIEPNDQTKARSEHLNQLRELVGNVYPNKFVRSSLIGAEDTITGILSYAPVAKITAEMSEVRANLKEGERPPAEIKEQLNNRLKELGNVRIAGRLTTPPRGNFVHLTDGMNKLQIYCKKGQFALIKNDGSDTLDAENGWTAWQLIDHGDFIGIEGYLFVTNTGEVSVHVEKLQFLSKAMLPMPDKMHGIEDPEIKQRRRYVDLIGSSLQVKSALPALVGGQTVEQYDFTTREVFERRAKVISSMRNFLEDHGYIEVETPMLTPKATGAAAKPFKTHHNALDIDLYARIAPELYLKRLVVGGFEKVYELNRNFRNEGISYKHNPEFTMLEFYCAYMDVNGMMDFSESLIKQSVQTATGGLEVTVSDPNSPIREIVKIGFSEMQRFSMKEAVVKYWPKNARIEMSRGRFDTSWLNSISQIRYLATFLWLKKEVNMLSQAFLPGVRIGKEVLQKFVPSGYFQDKISLIDEEWISLADHFPNLAEELTQEYTEQFSSKFVSPEEEKSHVLAELFERFAERYIIQPTFITDFPKSISPLSKASPENPQVAERFELFINGMEVANGFSELNDPKEQYDRFIEQMAERERGDEEAMILDEDYIRALSYGMPPAAGIGIGIDRLVMLLTNRHSIRDVILFPHMRPEKGRTDEAEEDSE